jgi:hypothetical protein
MMKSKRNVSNYYQKIKDTDRPIKIGIHVRTIYYISDLDNIHLIHNSGKISLTSNGYILNDIYNFNKYYDYILTTMMHLIPYH